MAQGRLIVNLAKPYGAGRGGKDALKVPPALALSPPMRTRLPF
jgi:hypothetical protein